METDKMPSNSLADNKTETKRYRRPSLHKSVKQAIRNYLATDDVGYINDFRYYLNSLSDTSREAGLYDFLYGRYVNGVNQRNILTPKVKAYLTWVSRETIRDAPSRDN